MCTRPVLSVVCGVVCGGGGAGDVRQLEVGNTAYAGIVSTEFNAVKRCSVQYTGVVFLTKHPACLVECRHPVS